VSPWSPDSPARIEYEAKPTSHERLQRHQHTPIRGRAHYCPCYPSAHNFPLMNNCANGLRMKKGVHSPFSIPDPPIPRSPDFLYSHFGVFPEPLFTPSSLCKIRNTVASNVHSSGRCLGVQSTYDLVRDKWRKKRVLL
jgi:hypothetical protein